MNIIKAIHHIYADKAEFTITGDPSCYENLVWLSKDLPKPTIDELVAAFSEAEALERKTAYIEKRKAEYPSIGDQLDALWKLIQPPTGTDAYLMKERILEIKSKYPKEVG